MLDRNTPLGNSLQSNGAIIIFQANRSDLQMSYAVRIQVGQAASVIPQAKVVRLTNRNQMQTTSNLLPTGTYMI